MANSDFFTKWVMAIVIVVSDVIQWPNLMTCNAVSKKVLTTLPISL